MLAPVLEVAPVLPVLSLTEIKAHLSIDGHDHDDELPEYVAAAEAYLDGWSGVLRRALVSQTWSQEFPRFMDRLGLALAPVQSVVSVTYFDTADAEQTLAGSVYTLLADGGGSFVRLARGQSWPGVADRPDAVKVTYLAGYGTAPQSVPANLRKAAAMIAGSLHMNRETQAPVELHDVPMGVNRLIAPFRRFTL